MGTFLFKPSGHAIESSHDIYYCELKRLNEPMTIRLHPT